MWGVDRVGGDWPFFVKAPELSRKDIKAFMPSLVPRRSGQVGTVFVILRVGYCDVFHRLGNLG